MMMNGSMRTQRPRHRTVRRILCAASAVLAVLAGCSSTQPANPGPVPTISSADSKTPASGSGETRSSALPGAALTPASSGTAPAASSPASANGRGPTKALVIVEENHSERAALEQMPYLAGLAEEFGRATAYRAVTHPSLPNYLALAGGSTFGVSDDEPPPSHPIQQVSVFDAVIAAGGSAKTYAEAMPEPCTLEPVGRYAVKHNPWAYFSSSTSRGNCGRFDVPAGDPGNGALHDDVVAGVLPTVGLLIPDMCNDGHDCPLSTTDEWLHQWLPVIMDGPDYRAGDLAVVVTFDEDDHTADNAVLTTVIAPMVSQVVTDAPLTHYSLSRYLAELGGASPLGEAATAASLRAPFGL
jgi:acid phosphatase